MARNAKVWAVPPTDGVDSLTAAEAVALDNGQFAAITENGGTWTAAAVIEIGGAGLQVDKQFLQYRTITGVYALDGTGPDVVLLADTTAGNVTVNLPSASLNRVVRVKKQAGANILHIAPNGTDTIEGINATYNLTQTGSALVLVGITGGWAIVGKSSNPASLTILATTASAWTAPAGCYWVDLEMCGQGGGGAGGASGTVGTSIRASGGPGGGGAKLVKQRVAVVPGTAYDATIGTSANGGAAGSAGSDGASTTFAVHAGATLATAPGGGGGTIPPSPSTNTTYNPGGTIAGAPSNLPATDTARKIAAAYQGGFGVGSASASTSGATSDTGYLGGGAGATGGDSAGTWGGTGGAGGGGGAYGAGAAGQAGGTANAVGGNTGGPGIAGGSATANTGGGGAGGGGGGCGTAAGGSGGTGGNGGTGKLVIYWVE